MEGNYDFYYHLQYRFFNLERVVYFKFFFQKKKKCFMRCFRLRWWLFVVWLWCFYMQLSFLSLLCAVLIFDRSFLVLFSFSN